MSKYVLGTPVYHGNGGWADFKIIKESDDIEDLLKCNISFDIDAHKPIVRGSRIKIPYPKQWMDVGMVYIGQKSDFGNGIKPLYEWGPDGWEKSY